MEYAFMQQPSHIYLSPCSPSPTGTSTPPPSAGGPGVSRTYTSTCTGRRGRGRGSQCRGWIGLPAAGGHSTPPALLSAVYYLPRSAILSCPFGQYSRQRAGPGRVAKPVSIPTVPPAPGQGGMEEDTGTLKFLFELKSLSLFMYLRNS